VSGMGNKPDHECQILPLFPVLCPLFPIASRNCLRRTGTVSPSIQL
jgi:hypothetical protein